MQNSAAIEFPQQSQKSGHEVVMDLAKPVSTHGSFARLKHRVQRNTRKYYGDRRVAQYLIQLQCRKRRDWFELGPDLDAAVKKAREIDQYLKLHGWDETRQKFKPEFAAELSELTVGGYLEIVRQHGQLQQNTMFNYACVLRRIVSGVAGINMGGRDKYDGRSNRSNWRMAVEKVLLNTIRPDVVIKWRDAYVARHPIGSEKRISSEHSANSFIRGARALFAKRVLNRVRIHCPNLALPSPLPFEGVELLPERESDFFYTSQVDAKQLIEDAFRELSGNQLVIFVLGIGAGLRRNEMDKLLWVNVDLAEGIVTVAPTKYYRLKSDSSVGKIQLEPRFAEVLRRQAATTHGEFVLFSTNPPKADGERRYYRCDTDFTSLCAWLAQKGITDSTSRIHVLRKEFGSHLAQRRGIFAASAGLRHSTIGVTRKYYVSSKIEPTTFFTPEPAKAVDAAQVIELLKKTLEQGGAKVTTQSG